MASDKQQLFDMGFDAARIDCQYQNMVLSKLSD